MVKKIFKNRMTQETEATMRKLKSTFIEMNADKQFTQNTPQGTFSISINPNQPIDSITLEKTFRSILSHYYHWRYGSKWKSIKNLQHYFEGVIEKQQYGTNHIHFNIYQPDIVEVAIFAGYIKAMFQSLFHRVSCKVKRVYDIDGWLDYMSPFVSNKKRFKAKPRIEVPTFISSELFGADYTG